MRPTVSWVKLRPMINNSWLSSSQRVETGDCESDIMRHPISKEGARDILLYCDIRGSAMVESTYFLEV
jgi:hypothetical protein